MSTPSYNSTITSGGSSEDRNNMMSPWSWSSEEKLDCSNGKSPSIPIAQSEEYIREENEKYQEAIRADYRDFAFCARLVEGMRKQQKHQENPALVYQNQVVIDHIIDTRRGIRDDDTGTFEAAAAAEFCSSHPFLVGSQHNTMEDYGEHNNMFRVGTLLQDIVGMVQKDDMMFELDL
mmetsp:Transcript_89538/g.134233  ORF Transcript_89538/g.134233 Transcript_89538/m.134233 type:complete len:177 (-) Transcript_89538:162-692(-)